ncbi:uncharacterized protein METZ01_LOCUS397478, partial [marine metagenome]
MPPVKALAMKTPFAFLGALCLSLGILLIGCKPKPDGAGPGGSSQEATIAYVTNGVDPFWDLCAAGVRIAEKEFAIKCEVHMPTKGVVDQKRIMEGLLAKGVAGIAVSPVDAENQTPFLNEVAQNSKLITQDADAPRSNRIAYIGT